MVALIAILALLIGLGGGWALHAFIVPALALPSHTDDAVTPTIPNTLPEDVRPAAPISSATMALPPQVIGYHAYVVEEGDNLSSIAANGGSDAAYVKRYNRLRGPLQPGQPILVPQFAGQVSTLPDETLIIERGRTDKPWVALTLDAGAAAEPVPSMLQVLRERDIQITFFLTGTWIQQNPDLARQIVADGHEVANHSLTHPDLRDLSDAEIAQELAETEHLLHTLTGTSTRPLFRPPYGAYNERVLRVIIDQGYLPISWTLDSLDSVGEPKTPGFLIERVTNTLPLEELHGAIILAHCGSTATADALPAILDHFEQLGLEVRTLSDVLGH